MDSNPHYNVVLVCGILDKNQQVDSQSLHYYNFNKIPIAIAGYNSKSIQSLCRSPVGKPADFKHLKVLNVETKIRHLSNIAKYQMGAKYCMQILAASKDNANILHFFNGNEEQLTPTNQLNRQDARISPYQQLIGCKRLRNRYIDVALVFSFFRDTNAVVNAQHTDDSVINHISEIAQSWKLQWLNKLEINDDNLMQRFECPLQSKTRSDSVCSFDFSMLDWPLSKYGPVQAGCDLHDAFSEEADLDDGVDQDPLQPDATATSAMQLHAFVGTQLASGEIHESPSEWFSPVASESLLMGATATGATLYGSFGTPSASRGFGNFAESPSEWLSPVASATAAALYGPFGTPSTSGGFGNFAQPQAAYNSSAPVGSSFIEANPYAFDELQSVSGGSDDTPIGNFIDAYIDDPTNDPCLLRERYDKLIKDRSDDEFVMVRVDDFKNILSYVHL